MRLILTVCLSLTFFSQTLAQSEPTVVVKGLFPGKAVLKVNGRIKTLTVQGGSYQGVKLITADSEQAVLDINGQQKVYYLGRDYGAIAARTEASVTISKDLQGMYRISGQINGRSVSMLVDTGASQIALSAQKARALGVEYVGQPQQLVNTASGMTSAYQVSLTKVKVGEIELQHVEALVIEGDYPQEVLLGMSFLKRVEMQDDGQLMVLTQKW